MTILSKKKVAPGKADQENAEPSNNPTAGTSPPQGPEQHYSPGHLSPGHRWSPHRPDDFTTEPTHEASNRKRHRASPHRVVRTKRERNQSSPPSASQGSPGAAALNPVPDPSGGPADPSGYNSGDEYNMDNDEEMTENHWLEKDRIFMKKMQKRGFEIKEMGRDGACLFRAVADQVYGDQEMHSDVRQHCMDYVEHNRDHFSQYVTEDFSMYVDRKRKASVHGNHIELQALCEMYNRPVQVFCYKTEPINIFHNDKPNDNANDNEPIRLSYERGSHYNSIVDPHKASIGVGLGLPNFKPGLADQNMMADALMQSDNFEIEQAMLQDKIFASDLEATNIVIEEQVARASYLEWVRETEKQSKTKHASSTATSTVTSSSPRSRSHGGSPVPVDNIRNSPRSSPKAGPSSSSDHFLQQFDASLPGTSSSQYYFEGPSTSSFQGESSHTMNAAQAVMARTSSSTPRNLGDSSQSAPKTAEGSLRNRLHQFGLSKGPKSTDKKLSFRDLTVEQVDHLVKRFVSSRNTPSSSPGSSTD